MMKRVGLVILMALVIVAAPAWSVSQTVKPTVVQAIKPPVVLKSNEASFGLPYSSEMPVFTAESIPKAYRVAMNGLSWKKGCPVPMDKLRLVKVGYVGFDGRSMQGEMVVHQNVSDEILSIFKELYAAGYPIKTMAVVDIYQGDDTLSMDADNTSAFNYRTVPGSKTLSKHSFGIAIDINPIENPYIKGKVLSPSAGRTYSERSRILPGMIIPGDACYQAFISRGWVWGGNWKSLKDYQHFEKPLKISGLK